MWVWSNKWIRAGSDGRLSMRRYEPWHLASHRCKVTSQCSWIASNFRSEMWQMHRVKLPSKVFSAGPFIVTRAWSDCYKFSFKSKEGKKEKEEITSLAASRLACSRGIFIRVRWHFYMNRRTKNGTECFSWWKWCCFIPGFCKSLVKYYSPSQVTTGCRAHLMLQLASIGSLVL